LNTFKINKEKELQDNLLIFCNKICGVRDQKYLSITIEQSLADCLDFENACALFVQDKRLFTMRYFKNDYGEYLAEGFIELPSTVGLTGEAIKTKQKVCSVYGKNDTLYNSQVDNILKLKRIENLLVVPLYVSKDVVICKADKKTPELVGVLHLINYKLGDIKKMEEVRLWSIE
jgi:hypothetical protein